MGPTIAIITSFLKVLPGIMLDDSRCIWGCVIWCCGCALGISCVIRPEEGMDYHCIDKSFDLEPREQPHSFGEIWGVGLFSEFGPNV